MARMKLKTAKDVIGVARARGFSIRVDAGPPPMPVLVRPGKLDRSNVTDALMNALKAWRLEIIDELARETQSNGHA
jgi:hypothetical protein